MLVLASHNDNLLRRVCNRIVELEGGNVKHAGSTEAFFGADTLSDGSISINKSFGTFNAARLPAYHRLDLRATRNFRVGRNRLAVYLDVFNVYDHANLRGYEHRLSFNNGRLTAERVGDELLPLLPTFGVRFDF